MRLDDRDVTRVLFHPRGEGWGSKPRGIATTTRVAEANIGGYLHPNEASDALLLFFHGNGEVAADYDPLADLYTGGGASFWVVDYRGYGQSSGRPSYSCLIADAEAFIDSLAEVEKTVQRSFRRVLVMGRSLGSAPALHLAARYPGKVSGLILDSGFACVRDLIARIGGPKLGPDAMEGAPDNIDRMALCSAPTLILHGMDDQLIPFSDAEALCQACRSPVRRLVPIPGAGHNDLLSEGYADYRAALWEHIARATA